MRNAVVRIVWGRVAIMHIDQHRAAGGLGAFAATEPFVCGQSRPVRGRLSA